MSFKHWRNDNWQEETDVLRQKPTPMALCPPEISGLGAKKSMTNLLSCDSIWLGSISTEYTLMETSHAASKTS
jgi:hypothetical protein